MSVTTNLPYKRYAGNGSAPSFEFQSKVDSSAELRVAYILKSTGVKVSDWTYGVEYTATGFGTSTLTVTPATVLPSTHEILIYTSLALTQENDYQDLDQFPADQFEEDLDKGIRIDQQLQRLADQSVKVGVEELGNGVSLSVPTLASRKSKLLAFDANGVPTVATPGSSAPSDALSITYTATGGTERTQASKNAETVTPIDFGAVGDGSTDDTAALQSWLNRIDSTGSVGVLASGKTFACATSLTLPQTGPIRIRGGGTIKATGTARFEMLIFEDVQHDLDIDEITIDANNLVARPVVVESESVAVANLADVTFGKSFAVKNTKELSGSAGGYGVYCLGGFRKVMFDGLIDGVTSSRADGSCVTSGVEVAKSAAGAEDYPRHVVCGPNARIIGVTNNNTDASPDADGFKVRVGVATTDATLTVSPGAYFENCLGRAIKSQAQNNSVTGATILRNAYNGQVEIDIQRAGGIVSGNIIIQDGYSSSAIIGGTMPAAADSDTRSMSISDNTLMVMGAPAAATTTFALISGADATSAITGVSLNGNKVAGEVTYFLSVRVANVAGNRVSLRDNWAKTIGTAFVELWRQGAGAVECRFVASGNSSDAACDGIAEATNCTAYIEDWNSNYNLSDENTVP